MTKAECIDLITDVFNCIDFGMVAMPNTITNWYISHPNRKIKFDDDSTCKHLTLSKFTDGKYRCNDCDKIITINTTA